MLLRKSLSAFPSHYESHIREFIKHLSIHHIQKPRGGIYKSIPFSAFWLRSSVVSVLISLISDTWAIGSHDIKLIFKRGRSTTVACYWDSQASPMCCTTTRAWRTPPSPVQSFLSETSLLNLHLTMYLWPSL